MLKTLYEKVKIWYCFKKIFFLFLESLKLATVYLRVYMNILYHNICFRQIYYIFL